MRFSIPARESHLTLSQSENQRINPQRRKKDSPLPPGKKLGCLPGGAVVEDRADLGTQVRQVKMGQDKGLQLDNQMFVGRKNIVVGELDLAVEVLATALGIIMECFVLLKVCFGSFVLVFMVEAVHTLVCHYAKTAHKLVVFGTIVEFHVPPDRDEQHREGQQKGADLQQPIFHSFISPKSLSSTKQGSAASHPCSLWRFGRHNFRGCIQFPFEDIPYGTKST